MFFLKFEKWIIAPVESIHLFTVNIMITVARWRLQSDSDGREGTWHAWHRPSTSADKCHNWIMKLNDDLQNYLAQSSSKSKASLSSGIKGSDGLLTFWNSNTQAPNAAVVDFDNEPSATSDSGASGWFKSMRVPLLGGSQLSNSEINPPSRIARLCSCFPTLVRSS